MRLFLTGVACVGKTAIGEHLASLFGYPFVDFGPALESFYETSMERLWARFLTTYEFRRETVKVLRGILEERRHENLVCAFMPSGLMAPYGKALRAAGCLTIVLTDRPENVLERITFYDIDSKRVNKALSEREKALCLKEIREDMAYFQPSYRKASLTFDIGGDDAETAARRLHAEVLSRWEN